MVGLDPQGRSFRPSGRKERSGRRRAVGSSRNSNPRCPKIVFEHGFADAGAGCRRPRVPNAGATEAADGMATIEASVLSARHTLPPDDARDDFPTACGYRMHDEAALRTGPPPMQEQTNTVDLDGSIIRWDGEALVLPSISAIREIGSGAHGKVFEGFDHNLERRVSIKIWCRPIR